MLPFLLMILHFSQIGFTDDLTFILTLLPLHLWQLESHETAFLKKAQFHILKKTVLYYSMGLPRLQGLFPVNFAEIP